MATVQTLSPTPTPSPDGHSLLQNLSPILTAVTSPTLAAASAPETSCKQDEPINITKYNKELDLINATQSKPKLNFRNKKRKRRHSFNEGNKGGKFRRNGNHRKHSSYMLPNKFLHGGNIADPLNLNSMSDEKVNRALNAVTPSSSPLPPRNTVVDVVVPNDITDPLGLNTGSDVEPISSILEPNNSASKRKKRKRRLKSNTKPGSAGDEISKVSTSDDQKDNESKTDDAPSTSTEIKKPGKKRPVYMKIRPQGKLNDPIVSPVIPQDKRRRRNGFSPKNKRRQRSYNAARTLATEIGISSVEKNRAESEKNEERHNLPMRRRTFSENILSSTDRPKSEDIDVIIKSCFGSNLFKFDKVLNDNENTLNTKQNKSMEPNSSNLTGNPESNSPVKQIKPQSEKSSKGPSKNNSNKQKNQKPKFKPSGSKYQYGNYSQYYGYRNPSKFQDKRLSSFKKEWFKDRDVLDVGCNSGHLTLLIARDFNPRKIVGIDIDESLIHCARTNIRHYTTGSRSTNSKFPMSFQVSLGPISAPPIEANLDQAHSFPYNVNFFHGNYVPVNDDVLNFQEPEYDIIMCLSVSKWIHLNFGDEGLKRMFQRVFKQLRPGGKFVFEPQPWKSYMRKKKLTETIYNNFNSIKLKPPAFPTYLRDEVGFKKVEYLETPLEDAKGFDRPIHIYYKPE